MRHKALMRDILSLSWPAVLQGLVATVVLFTDRLILGRYATEALGSMSISSPLMWSVYSVFGAYGAGVIAVIGRHIGAGRRERASHAAKRVVQFALGVGLVVGVCGFLARHAITHLVAGGAQTTAQVRAMAAVYMGTLFIAAPFQFVATTSTVVLQASGDTRTPMRAAALAGTLNLVVSWTLVFGVGPIPELGVQGAAIGSAVSFATQAIVLIRVLSLGRGPIRLGTDSPSQVGHPLRDVLLISRATWAEKVLYHSAYVVFAALIGRLGDVPMAAHQALIAIESFGFIGAEGFGVAAAALVAQKLGASRGADAGRVGWLTTALSSAVMFIFGLSFLIFPRALMAIFTNDPEVIELGARCLMVAAFAQPVMAASEAFSGALRGAGDTTTPMVAAFLGPVVVRIIACYYFAYVAGWGLLGIWVGSTLDWTVRAMWTGSAYLRGRWHGIRPTVA